MFEGEVLCEGEGARFCVRVKVRFCVRVRSGVRENMSCEVHAPSGDERLKSTASHCTNPTSPRSLSLFRGVGARESMDDSHKKGTGEGPDHQGHWELIIIHHAW